MNENGLFIYGKKSMNEVGGFSKYNHYQLVDLTKDYCIMDADLTTDSLNPYGLAHGGFLFGLADTAAGALACVDGRKAVTLSSHIEYLHPVYGQKVRAVVKILKSGKHIPLYEVSIFDSKGNMDCKITLEYYYLN